MHIFNVHTFMHTSHVHTIMHTLHAHTCMCKLNVNTFMHIFDVDISMHILDVHIFKWMYQMLQVVTLDCAQDSTQVLASVSIRMKWQSKSQLPKQEPKKVATSKVNTNIYKIKLCQMLEAAREAIVCIKQRMQSKRHMLKQQTNRHEYI